MKDLEKKYKEAKENLKGLRPTGRPSKEDHDLFHRAEKMVGTHYVLVQSAGSTVTVFIKCSDCQARETFNALTPYKFLYNINAGENRLMLSLKKLCKISLSAFYDFSVPIRKFRVRKKCSFSKVEQRLELLYSKQNYIKPFQSRQNSWALMQQLYPQKTICHEIDAKKISERFSIIKNRNIKGFHQE